jgi:hypothetical protein
MPFPPDRFPPDILEQPYPALPLPPLNVFVSSAFLKETFDIRWTLPSELQANSKFSILGVNIYRSFDSEYGPWERLNNVPVGSTYWRDQTRTVLALQEDVSQNFFFRGPTSDPDGRYAFKTNFNPIVIYPSPGSENVTNLNVQVTVNGVPAFVDSINAPRGEVELRREPTFNVVNQTLTDAVLPKNPTDVVLATYRYLSNQVPTTLAQRIFYRITTVAFDPGTGQLLETHLSMATATNNREIEKLDYMWREAVRRQKWILEQGGERVKVMIRKATGRKCGCYSSYYRQPNADCVVCYGTGVIGGYDGPYDINIAPDDATKGITQQARGRTVDHTYEAWALPSPLMNQRDFIVKLNGDRYAIGPVRMPSNRGMQLAQFFEISKINESDIRYQVPVLNTAVLVAPQTRYTIPGKGDATPMMTDDPTIPAERQIRSATVAGANEQRR